MELNIRVVTIWFASGKQNEMSSIWRASIMSVRFTYTTIATIVIPVMTVLATSAEIILDVAVSK
jgi:hypothetical protein